MRTVEHLNKVSLLIQAGTSPERMDIAPIPLAYDFVFGVGSQGMTPFECTLANKPLEEEFVIHLEKKSVADFFEHIRLPLGDLFDQRHEAYLKIRIADASPADDRTIVKQMAQLAAHGGGGCDCGCGCG
ncbi:MAG: hypothetical protein RBT11_06930 [Desulfobacterales bacterium]|jgi:hypothetical protein|nr:hypothetical protein [Desulfobacterales bacterium]